MQEQPGRCLKRSPAVNPLPRERAIKALLNHHIVRLRASAGGQLLSDVGGPYVLAPRQRAATPPRSHDRQLRALDPGRRRLPAPDQTPRRARRADVHGSRLRPPQLVKDSLGPMPGPALASVPASGAYRHQGRSFRVFTLHAAAFPSGPLTIRVLVPIPYPGA